MISFDDIVGMTDLTEEEIAAIAEHEHVPEITAAAFGEYLMHEHHGPARVQGMICDDIRSALHARDAVKAKSLYMALKAFMERHPDAAHGVG